MLRHSYARRHCMPRHCPAGEVGEPLLRPLGRAVLMRKGPLTNFTTTTSTVTSQLHRRMLGFQHINLLAIPEQLP